MRRNRFIDALATAVSPYNSELRDAAGIAEEYAGATGFVASVP